MKKPDTLIKIIIALSIVLLIFSIDDFLSLHDIKKDYVSQSAIQYLETETSKTLPGWTETSLEWLSISISYIVRVLSVLISLYILILLQKKLKEA